MDMKKLAGMFIIILGLWGICNPTQAQKTDKRKFGFNVKANKKAVIGEKEVTFNISIFDSTWKTAKYVNKPLFFTIIKKDKKEIRKDTMLTFKQGAFVYKTKIKSSQDITFTFNDTNTSMTLRVKYFPTWMSILPALMAIAFALLFREVIVSIFAGVFLGAWILSGLGVFDLIPAVLTVADTYLMKALNDGDHISIILFTMMIGGIVAIVSKNGGMAGVVKVLSKLANSARNTQLVTWLLGIAIFFDDYANTLVVGNTMRSVTDRFKVSREKLAYIVDSTSAPVAAIAFVTTWIGAELSYIQDSVQQINGDAKFTGNWQIKEGAYSIFLNSLEYSFYPILAIFFMLILLFTRRDFGPMYKAEMRARRGEIQELKVSAAENEEFEPIKKEYLKWYNAFLPIMVVIVGTIIGLVYTGMDSVAQKLGTSDVWNNLASLNEGKDPGTIRKVGIILGEANSYVTLIWSSLLGLILAVILTVSQRIMSLKQTMDTMANGFKTILGSVLILLFAWALASVNKDLGTGDYLTGLIRDSGLSAYWLPVVTFMLAAFVAFSTGSSWSTMAILYPLILPAVWKTAKSSGLDPTEAMNIFYHVTAVVLAGSVFGDHCSPISDTTILSSMASGSDHIQHVRTQMPYALTVATVSIVASSAFFMIGVPWYLTYLISLGILFGVVRILGKPVPEAV
ncbi:sodium:proton antiporter [marine bacterium AO1-C]|nr:sodium:proton antiporter [marine bacterium AO1-C]